MVILICCIVGLLLNAIISWKFAQIAQLKGYDGFFWYCFFFGIAGYLMVVALPETETYEVFKTDHSPNNGSKSYNLTSLSRDEESSRAHNWVCQKCGEINPSSTISCKSCGEYK